MILTAASYNILHGAAVGYDWSRLAAAIRESGADAVGLQEVDRHTGRAGGTDGVAELLRLLGWQYGRFVPAMPYDGGEYGIALLSRYPAVCPERLSCIPLPHREGEEPRFCMHTVIRLPASRAASARPGRLHMLNTHLAYETPVSRQPQIEVLRGCLRQIPVDEPFVLTGDFNTETYSELLPLLTERAALANCLDPGRPSSAAHFKTFREPPLAIDNILYDAQNMTLSACGMREGNESDHNLLWVRLEV